MVVQLRDERARCCEDGRTFQADATHASRYAVLVSRLRSAQALMICYCKREIAPDARTIQVDVWVDWGSDDLRPQPDPKRYVFCSFKCASDWAADRAAAHDDVVVKEGVPDAAS